MTRVLTYMSAAVLLLAAPRASADDAIAEWAKWVLTPKVWKGQIVQAPVPAQRPTGLPLELRSLPLPLAVHAAADAREPGLAALAALERAYLSFAQAGWLLPPAGVDLYLVPGAVAPSGAEVDALLALSDFDQAETYAVVRAGSAGLSLDACVRAAFTQAVLRALDPAEAASWVRATAEWSAFQATGEPGCEESMVLGQQQPEHSLLNADAPAAGSGALLLALLAERHGDDFVRALWELTRQRSKRLVADDRLRGSPDVWEVLARLLESNRERWTDAVEELAIARWFAGEPRRRSAAAYRVLASLPSDARVPVLAELSVAQLPKHVRTAADSGIEPLGSAYVSLQLPAARDCSAGSCELRVWLRGELGPNWSLCALTLAADGRELGRLRAPARNVPESFLPLAVEDEVSEVVLVVTHLTRTVPDADEPLPAPHGVELTLEWSGQAAAGK